MLTSGVFIWDFNPVLAHLGPFTIYYYGLCFALGLGLTYHFGLKEVRRQGLSTEHWESLALWITLGAIIGARLGHVFFYSWDYFSKHLGEIPLLWQGGLSSHGGILGSLLALALYTLKNKGFDWRKYADIIAQYGAIMVIAVRLGNFFNSEIVGRPTDMPWGVVFERVDFTPRHPSQLYELILGLAILGIMGWLNKKSIRRTPGFYLSLFGILYFAGRFFLEFFKDLAIHSDLLGLTTGQLLCVPFFIFALILHLAPKTDRANSNHPLSERE